MSFIRLIILSSILSMFGTAFSPLIAQQNTFDCNVLWDKLQASNRFLSNSAAKSEDYFFQEYCGCLHATGDSAKWNQFRYVTNLSAFSGGYAFKKTYWYCAIVDSNFKEISKTINLDARYLGFGYYIEKQFGQLVLMNAFGKKVATPKLYESIDVMSSSTTGKVLLIGKTGLTCDAFTAEGTILKTWEGISKIEILSDHLLLLYRYNPPKTEYNYGTEKKSIYTADLEEVLPFSDGRMNLINDSYIFVTEQKEAFVFDREGRLKLRQANVQYRDSKTDFKMVSQINGKWMNYDLEKGIFDSLVPHPVLNQLGYSVLIHPTNNKAFLIRNAKAQAVFTEPITWMEQLDESWFLIIAGTISYNWNPSSGKKITQPKTYAEAKALSTSETIKTDYTTYPFLYNTVRYDDEKKRIKSQQCSIYESYSYDAAGKQKELIRLDYHWSITAAHLVIKKGYCFNYNANNQLVDSFPADEVYELHQNNLLNFKDHPEFIPLAYSWKGKKGLFYLGNVQHGPANYDVINSYKDRVFRITVQQNERGGVIDPMGQILVPIKYTSIYMNEKGYMEAHTQTDQGRSKTSVYFSIPAFAPLIDSSIYFVPSLHRKLMLRTHISDLSSTCYDLDNGTKKIGVNQTLIPVLKGLYIAVNGADYQTQLVDELSNPIVSIKINDYCVMPNGIYIDGDESIGKYVFYSSEKKALKPLDLNLKLDDRNANQIIGEKEGQSYLINADDSQTKLPEGYRYKITNYTGLVYYTPAGENELWGLMKSDGTQLTEAIYEKVYDFEGEHGIVWKQSKRYYIDAKGKIVAF